MDSGKDHRYHGPMGIQDRKEKQKTKLRRDIMDAAVALAQRDGWREVSIRKVVEKIEYAPSVVYQHFDNKDELLRALREEGFGLLTEELARLKADSPRALLCNLAVCFWEFAQANRAYYAVMMELDGVAFADKKASPGSVRLMEFVAATIGSWAASEGLDPSKLTMEWFEFVLFLHGLVAASTVSFIQDAEERIRYLLDLGIKDFITAWSLRLVVR